MCLNNIINAFTDNTLDSGNNCRMVACAVPQLPLVLERMDFLLCPC